MRGFEWSVLDRQVDTINCLFLFFYHLLEDLPLICLFVCLSVFLFWNILSSVHSFT